MSASNQDDPAAVGEQGLEPVVVPQLPPRHPLQFSLQSLFILTTLLAVLCSGLFAGPMWVTTVTLFFLATFVLIAVTTAVIYGRGYFRTFFIGALFPCFPLALCWAYCVVTIVGGLAGGGLNALDHAFETTPDSGSTATREARLVIAAGIGTVAFTIVLCGLFTMIVRWLVERAQRDRA